MGRCEGREGTIYLCGYPFGILHLPSFQLACGLILGKLEVAALRGEVVSKPQASRSVCAVCRRRLRPWTAVLIDDYGCGLCTLSSLRLVALGNAETDGE